MSADVTRESNGAGKEVCPICHGAGFVRLDVPVGDPRFGKAIPCRCKLRAIQERRIAALRKTSNLEHLREMTFENFKTEGPEAAEVSVALQEALNAAREFAADPSKKRWIVFTGAYGCGKTHLAAAIANYRIERGLPVLFVVVPDLLDYLRAAYAPESPVTYDERFEQVRNVELLILDDLGTQNATPWAAEKLYQLLNYRYNAKLPTVITTNQSIEDMDPRLASRLRDQDLVLTVPIYATDHRSKGKDETFGILSHYNRLTFETFSDRRGEIEPEASKRLRQIVRRVQAYAQNPNNWLVLRGGHFVGKTHLAAAVANKVLRSGKIVRFVVVADLLDHLRATFQPGSPVSYDQRFNEVRRAWLLVLDDMSTQSTTPWAQEKLFQILNYRYHSGLPTVITISKTDWEKLDERLKSRLSDVSVCEVIDIDVPSYRGTPPEPTSPRATTRRRP